MLLKKLNVYKVKDKKVRLPSDAVKIARSLILEEDFDKEHLIVLYLKTNNAVKSAEVVHIGDLRMTIASPVCVFRSAILNAIRSIIILHNHPSGILEPSDADIKVYEQLKKGGDILSIKVLDSIIFNKKGENYSLNNL